MLIGLTGGIGSGKSLAAQYFGHLGAKVIDADDLARQAIERGSDGFNEVVALFGDSILKDGDIDRKELGRVVFADPEKRRALETIVHPRVRDSFVSAVKYLGEGEILIYEIPLLVESGAQERFDFIITVESPLDERIERLKKKGMFSSDIQARIASQASSETRREISDYVLENDGTADDLFHKVEKVWNEILPNIARQKS